MNLIEQLGGYERASKFCDKEIKDGGYPYGLIDELLEYRRENNIFEVGDLVVFSLLGNEVIQYADWLKSQNQDWIRHATGKEIEQGYRDE